MYIKISSKELTAAKRGETINEFCLGVNDVNRKKCKQKCYLFFLFSANQTQ